jgi:hypothetical protein
MPDLLQTPTAQLVIGLATLLVLSMVGAYVVLRFRDSIEDDETTNDLLTKFREMHHQGYLSEAEYRTIRTDLGGQLSRELQDKIRAGEKDERNSHPSSDSVENLR